MTNRCPECAAKVPLTARFCPACGTANSSRQTILGAVIAIAVLGLAIAVGLYAATRWDKPLIAGTGQAELTLPPHPATTGDEADWLSAAMKACDARAASEPDAVHFLVVPLTSTTRDRDRWRNVSLNTIGNAVVLPGDDTVRGLRDRTLTIDRGAYTFSVRDEKAQATRRWENITGVKWLSIAKAADIEAVRMQFKLRGKGRDDQWGNAIPRHRGNCYWINVFFDE